MTGKGTLLVVLATLLVLAGLATLNGAVIALSLPLLAYLAIGLFRRAEHMRLSAVRLVSADRVTVGTPVQVRLTVTNDGPPVAELRIDDAVARDLQVIEGETRLVTSLGSGESVDLEYTVRGPRGAHRFYTASARASDGFGLFHQQLEVAAPATVLMHPEVTRLQSIEIRPPRTRGFAGPIPARQGGAGLDFYAVREYQLGDRRRSVNWRLTARSEDRVFSNVFEQERIADVGLILDARLAKDVLTVHGSLFEHSVRAAAALAETFLNDGNRVGLLVYGSSLDVVFPGYGRVQRTRILRALGRATAGHHFVFESLQNLPTRLFPSQSQIVFVGPVGADDVATFTRLRAHGYAVMAVCPNPIAFEAHALAGSARAELAGRVAQAERDFGLQQLRRFGVQVVDWDVQQPLGATLHESLARQPAAPRQLTRVR